MNKLIDFKTKLLDAIYKYRFVIALIILVIAVLCELHGSSIGLWNSIFTTGITTDNDILIGKPRSIRSDEWAVTTPLIFSQKYNSFNFYSDILRGGTTTDSFLLYGLPVLHLAEIYRPFHLGYIILGLTKGLSFFWVARTLALFLVSFEFLMILTNKNKRLSLIGTIMLQFAPIVQWWFATNGTAEILIFGQLALIMLYKYLNTTNFKNRIIYLLTMLICAGGYVLVFYPPFQIPMFYVFLFLAIYIIIENRKNSKIELKDIISICITAIIFIVSMALIFYLSKDTIITTINTAYPGTRVAKGGGSFRQYISYLDNVFLPYKENMVPTSCSEEAMMFGLFPIGIISAFIAMKKNKKKDLQLILLFIPYILIGIFCMFKIPLYAKLTLLSHSSPRAVLAIGYIDVLLLIRALSITDKSIKLRWAALISIITSSILVCLTRYLNHDYVGWILGLILEVISLYLFFTALQYNTKYGKYFFTLGIIPIMLICGAYVNPLAHGIDAIYDSPIIEAAEKINNEDEGIWLAEALPFPCPNYLEMAGCPVINATNIYPNVDLWKKFDPDNKYENVYNRYAHVYIQLVEKPEMIGDKFVLMTVDKIQLFITPEELKEMNIKYIFTVRVMEDFENENLDVDLIYNENNYHIYKVTYKD